MSLPEDAVRSEGDEDRREEKEETVEKDEKVETAEKSSGSFLTSRQLDVLKMRHSGLSQQDVADRLKTTRSNVSILEKRAHQNIARAKRTIQEWMMLCAPIAIEARKGMDVFDLPKMIFKAADELEIRLPVTSIDIVVQLGRRAPRLFKKRTIEKDARIYVTEEGEVLIEVLAEARKEGLKERQDP